MRIRIRTSSGDLFDTEQYSADDGATWRPIDMAAVAAMLAPTGKDYVLALDVLTGTWRAVRSVMVESVQPASDPADIIPTEVERRIREELKHQLPGRINAEIDKRPPAPLPLGVQL
jgi:hypothetical protein